MAKRKSIKERIENGILMCPMSGCWLWSRHVDRHGYGQMTLRDPKRTVTAHRASWITFRGPIPSGMCVLHKCDVRCCVNPSHLFLGTNRDNMDDMTAKGRRNECKDGEKHHNARLRNEDIIAIRQLRSQKMKIKDIAAQFGVRAHHVSDIVNRRYWSHI